MTSKIEICSNALELIGDNPINSFQDGDSASLAANLYDSTYEAMLSYHPFSFALKQQRLNVLADSPDQLVNYQYALQKPTDLVFLWRLQPQSIYELIGDYIYSNNKEILATYTYKVDESKLPANFVKALQYKLASEFAMSIAENNGLAQLYEEKYIMAIGQAMAQDAKQRPMVGLQNNPYIQVRPY